MLWSSTCSIWNLRRTVVFSNSLINFLMFQCKQVKALQCTKTLNPEQVQPTVNYIESTSNSDNRNTEPVGH
jgi:hypothetical protein